jgi:hypothetical protein
MSHAARIVELTTAFNESMARFLVRLHTASPQQLMKRPDGGGWSAAQIAWHVGATNEAFAGLMDGSIPDAQPAPDGFTETPWSDIAHQVPAKIEAPKRFHPPADVAAAEAVAKLVASQQLLVTALSGLDESRAGLTVKSTLGTPISLYQVGNWAAAHVARHNSQIKRLLGT